jgi:hypothetical protein
MPLACSGSVQNALQRWRIVNPDQGGADGAIIRGMQRIFAMRTGLRGENRTKMHISCG